MVNVQADDQLEQLHFDTRRAWNIKVTQIPCGCPSMETPRAPRGCLAYYTGFSGDLKSFNYDGFSCYRYVYELTSGLLLRFCYFFTNA